MKAELVRAEVQRLIRPDEFQPFAITLVGGERAVIEHPENVAFDPRPGSSFDFYVLTAACDCSARSRTCRAWPSCPAGERWPARPSPGERPLVGPPAWRGRAEPGAAADPAPGAGPGG